MVQTSQFGTWDYVVFALMLVISACIGLYHAFAGGGQNTSEDVLLGRRQLSPYPVALSLAASFLSAIAVIGLPAEIYMYGIMHVLMGIAWIFAISVTAFIYIPLFYRLQLSSIYKYLNTRFNQAVRYGVVCAYFMHMVLYLGMVTYAPSLALSQVTGLNIWVAIMSTALVCIAYTAFGGIRAVVWTDVFQAAVMLAGLLAVLIQGSLRLGGFSNVWSVAQAGGRINFWNFDVDPRKRHTFWTIVVGGTFSWTATYSCNQTQVQRYLACRTERDAIKAVFLNLLGMCVLLVVGDLCGLVMYAWYSECDPLKANIVDNSNQLMPSFVMELLGDLPGLPGLFVASAYSATLSTISSGINSMSTVVVEDFLKPFWGGWQHISVKRRALISKLLAVFFGLVTIGVAGVASLLQGNIIQASLSFTGIIGGPVLGVFTLAALLPFANSKGTFVGLITGLVLSLWVGLGGQIYPPTAEFTDILDISVAGCSLNTTNITDIGQYSTIASLVSTANPSNERPTIADTFYSISYLHYSLIGWLGTVLVSIVISLVTGGNSKRHIDPTLLAPIYHKVREALSCRFGSGDQLKKNCVFENNEEHHEKNSLDKYSEIWTSDTTIASSYL
ncbi:sodium-coupled monocarboxylate transporter 1-like [Lethenteron reissneri]|uniref:sodium-coupled monocarboxylate transporter 1-like n=1 Tax=Lethenteron reissneri TaxID=7753 RepID=UPI002AB791FE|nr:sodium-coupled monocarboxylate transporter 1-like [Lethenteron reissneri]